MEKYMLSHNCPTCSTSLLLSDLPYVGQLVFCQECETTFEVVWLFPLELMPLAVQPKKKTENLSD
jgi:lysine biosynthesis protein LysW